ncbi:hypothetical protein EV182_007605, partial [Spiromyces aspiralis]
MSSSTYQRYSLKSLLLLPVLSQILGVVSAGYYSTLPSDKLPGALEYSTSLEGDLTSDTSHYTPSTSSTSSTGYSQCTPTTATVYETVPVTQTSIVTQSVPQYVTQATTAYDTSYVQIEVTEYNTQNVTETVTITSSKYVTVTQPIPTTQTIMVTKTSTSTATVAPAVEVPETVTVTFTDTAHPITMTTILPAPSSTIPMITSYLYLTTTETILQQVSGVCIPTVTQYSSQIGTLPKITYNVPASTY